MKNRKHIASLENWVRALRLNIRDFEERISRDEMTPEKHEKFMRMLAGSCLKVEEFATKTRRAIKGRESDHKKTLELLAGGFRYIQIATQYMVG